MGAQAGCQPIRVHRDGNWHLATGVDLLAARMDVRLQTLRLDHLQHSVRDAARQRVAAVRGAVHASLKQAGVFVGHPEGADRNLRACRGRVSGVVYNFNNDCYLTMWAVNALAGVDGVPAVDEQQNHKLPPNDQPGQ